MSSCNAPQRMRPNKMRRPNLLSLSRRVVTLRAVLSEKAYFFFLIFEISGLAQLWLPSFALAFFTDKEIQA